MDEITIEDAFSEEGKFKFAEGIDEYFPKLINLYPNADYNPMERKVELMLKKSQSAKVNALLTNLLT